jgi:hypothetical protein
MANGYFLIRPAALRLDIRILFAQPSKPFVPFVEDPIVLSIREFEITAEFHFSLPSVIDPKAWRFFAGRSRLLTRRR